MSANYDHAGEFPDKPNSGGGSGLRTCLIVVAVMAFVCLVVCGGLAYFVVTRGKQMGAELARRGITDAIRKSDLEEQDKQTIIREVDRVTDAFSRGDIGLDDVGNILTELAESPLIAVMMVHAAEKKYIQPSGLSGQEKQEASLALGRMARGVVEEKISQQQLEEALDYISYQTQEGQRQFRDTISDSVLRDFIKECKARADEAEIPEQPYDVDVGAEFSQAVDRALKKAGG